MQKDSIERRTAREEKKIRHLEWLQDLVSEGIPINKEDKEFLIRFAEEDWLLRYGLIKKKEKLPEKPEEIQKHHVPDTKTEGEKEADTYVDIIDDNVFEEDGDVVEITEKVYTDIRGDKRFIWEGGAKITKIDWLPKSVIYHEPEFVAWIDSINSGFQNMIAYKPFQMYCQQSKDWMADTDSIYHYETVEERREYAWREMDRIGENSLYFLDKYLHVKEATFDEGYMDYQSKPVHKVMAFLLDCGYSVEIGKPRQIAATTTIVGLALCKLMSKKNFFIKMIAQDEKKVEEIFDDKLKYPFSELPEWMYHKPGNDSGYKFSLVRKDKKGKKGGVNSRMEVVPPSVDAINGGAPPLVLVDEAGYIGILGKMIKQARPTMFMQDPNTGKMKQVRQIWIWGTGGEMDRKGKAYEEEYTQTLKAWNKREFDYGIVPLFFDYTTRPGMTRAEFIRQKKVYTVEGPEAESRMIEFRQTYPEIIEDMFMTSSKTLVPISYINDRLRIIRGLDHSQRSEYGYFEPVFDYEKPSKEHDDLPYEVIGAEFVPTQKDDPRASAEIFMHPKKDWKNRYYQGTDPIASDNGYSNMAGVVWDAQYNTIAGIVNYRDPNHKYTFQQIMLLSLYYDTATEGYKKKGIRELVEANIGMAYFDFKEYKGFGKSLVLRTELGDVFKGGTTLFGIDNRGARTRFIINKMYEMIELYGDKIFIETFWEQLSKFICKITDKGNETWETQDKRKYHDDVLFAAVFSYICNSSFEMRPPKSTQIKENEVKFRYKLVRDQFGNLSRVQVRA